MSAHKCLSMNGEGYVRVGVLMVGGKSWFPFRFVRTNANCLDSFQSFFCKTLL